MPKTECSVWSPVRLTNRTSKIRTFDNQTKFSSVLQTEHSVFGRLLYFFLSRFHVCNRTWFFFAALKQVSLLVLMCMFQVELLQHLQCRSSLRRVQGEWIRTRTRRVRTRGLHRSQDCHHVASRKTELNIWVDLTTATGNATQTSLR